MRYKDWDFLRRHILALISLNSHVSRISTIWSYMISCSLFHCSSRFVRIILSLEKFVQGKIMQNEMVMKGFFSSYDEHVTKRDNEEFLEGYDSVLCINNVKRYVYWCLFIPFWFKNPFKTMKVHFVMQTKTKYLYSNILYDMIF